MVMFVSRFHCESNPINRVWEQAKVYSRMYTNITFPHLCQIIDSALDFVSTDFIQKHFRNIMEYHKAYLEGKKGGKDLETAVRLYKSH